MNRNSKKIKVTCKKCNHDRLATGRFTRCYRGYDLCITCLDKHAMHCIFCGANLSLRDASFDRVQKEPMCNDCSIIMEYEKCEICKNYAYFTFNINGKIVCEPCFRDVTEICSICDEVILKSESERINGETVCNRCVDLALAMMIV